jgi:thiosulfate/3-mercaptopyruvate sulfurtransferase
VCTLNALQPQQHSGAGGNSYGRPGRIAGSVNPRAAHLLDPDTNEFLPADELRRRFAGVGAMDRPVITYCGGGIAASADALALVMLGHEHVKLYDASLSEWASDPSLRWKRGDLSNCSVQRLTQPLRIFAVVLFATEAAGADVAYDRAGAGQRPA